MRRVYGIKKKNKIKTTIKTLLAVLEAEKLLEFVPNSLYRYHKLDENSFKNKFINEWANQFSILLRVQPKKDKMIALKQSLELTKKKLLGNQITPFKDVLLKDYATHFFGLRKEFLSDRIREFLSP